MNQVFKRAVVVGIAMMAAILPARARSDAPLSLDAVLRAVLSVNPQVRAARFRWDAAEHQIIQAYTPADPQFEFSNQDSWRGFLYGSGLHNLTATQSLQFPGKALIQGGTAKRNAAIARLAYLAMVRDISAQAKTTYYQLQLDLAVQDLIAEDVADLERVLKVTQIAYTANAVTQGDFINAKFALEADRESLRQQLVTIANDKTALNILLDRRPEEPLQVERGFDMGAFEQSLEQVIDLAVSNRQEILQAALTEQNQDAAVSLARLEYAPDYTVGFGFDHWLIASFAPSLNHTQDWNFQISLNLPIFFWAKNEDLAAARRNLDAAREDFESIRNQTAGQVTSLYRQILRSRETALLYRNTLVPLAHQAFDVMLVAYQGSKTDFTTLISTFRQQTSARTAYLQAINQLLAQKIALEQLAGGTLQ